MKSKCPIVKFYKLFLASVTNMSYLDILSMTVAYVFDFEAVLASNMFMSFLAKEVRSLTLSEAVLPRMQGR